VLGKRLSSDFERRQEFDGVYIHKIIPGFAVVGYAAVCQQPPLIFQAPDQLCLAWASRGGEGICDFWSGSSERPDIHFTRLTGWKKFFAIRFEQGALLNIIVAESEKIFIEVPVNKNKIGTVVRHKSIPIVIAR
jgi:hypothetical protein